MSPTDQKQSGRQDEKLQHDIGQGGGYMDWWTSLAASIALLWIFCFIDGNAVLELRLLFHALTKAACHLYLALLPLRRAATHFADCARYLINNAQQTPSPHGYHHQGQPLARKGTLHFLEGMCVVCETVPNLMGAALSVGAAFCHMLQGGFYVLAATLRTIQINLFSQMNGEKERWDKERVRAKESEKKLNSKVLEYISVFCQDPVSALRIKVDVPPVYR
ncbi:uncharacterized protein LOC122999712 isoform X1 [Thunnus albacares]|uniref:uncharacterized protein LOC122999712 isoform X1 n=1 Tax=Thunnus albacares TaxID=8236 RepID=UPI001CF67C74|nr:uncharacterized protein LOC122999712 isoform X1 [Thunnus albacares]